MRSHFAAVSVILDSSFARPGLAPIWGGKKGEFRDWTSFGRDRKGQSYPVEYCLESVEEYSEGRVHKSEPEPRNGNVNTAYFNNQARGNSRISRTKFVYDEREHAMANFYLYLNFLLRICS